MKRIMLFLAFLLFITGSVFSFNFDLMNAIESGNVPKVHEALEKTEDIDATIIENFSPLALAIDIGNLEVVKVLVEAGADIENDSTYFPSAFFHASDLGNMKIMDYLLEQGADIEAKWTFETTPLLHALSKGNLAVSKYLIEAGANPNVTETDMGYTTLMYGVQIGEIELVQSILDAGAELNAKNVFSETALDFAIKMEYGEIEQFLREAGAKSGHR